MALLYVKEHTSCYNYEGRDSQTLQMVQLAKGELCKLTSNNNKIIYIAKGELKLMLGHRESLILSTGQMLLLPSEERVKGIATESVTYFWLNMGEIQNLCECFSLEMLLKEGDRDNEPFILQSSHHIIAFFTSCIEYLSVGLCCRFFLQMKVKEFFYLLRAFQSKEDLLQFFHPILSNDMSFSDFVLKNYQKVKTVNELAKLANYSLSGFQKRFKKVFGESAYAWIKGQKLKDIIHEITNENKSFKEISLDYGFSSPSHFNDFCKSNFGYTPGQIREKKLKYNLNENESK